MKNYVLIFIIVNLQVLIIKVGRPIIYMACCLSCYEARLAATTLVCI